MYLELYWRLVCFPKVFRKHIRDAADLNEQAEERLDLIIEQMKAAEGVMIRAALERRED